MRFPHRRFGLVIVCLAACVVAGGCSSSKVKVTGTILQNGQPVPTGPSSLEVMLIPDVPPGTPHTNYVGRCDASGKFEIQDVPPGKYKVAVTLPNPLPGSDKFGGQFSADKTPIVRDIDGKKPLDIDLAKP